jgi:UDP-glucuronate decarboxylase
VDSRINDLLDVNSSLGGETSLFLTGGTGFFGRALLRYLDALATQGSNPCRVTVMTRSVDRFLSTFPEFAGLSWLSFHEGDILGGAEAFPKTGTFSHVLHAAADSTLGPRMDPLDRFDQIVIGTRNALDFAVRGGAVRFLLTSSGGVYGAQPADLDAIPESYHGMPDPMIASNAYSIAKRQAEHLCALYADKTGLDVVVARCFAFVGRDLPLDAHFAIGNFIRDALRGSDILVNGDGTPVRSYLDQGDLAQWLLTLLARGRSGEAYNVGSEEAITIAELAELVRRVIAPASAVRLLRKPGADTAIRNRYLPSIAKAKAELGLCVATSIEEAILKIARVARESDVQHA